MRRDDAHYIVRLDRTPTWTLVFVGKRRRTWGFWRPLQAHLDQHMANGIPGWSWHEFENDIIHGPRLVSTELPFGDTPQQHRNR